MTATDVLVERNCSWSAAQAPSHLTIPPRLHVAIVTCTDSRPDLFDVLGLEPGEAHVLRNAGGVVTDDGFRAELQADSGVAPSFAIETSTDLDEDDAQSVRRVRRSAFLLYPEAVRGSVHDVASHELREVVVPGRSGDRRERALSPVRLAAS